MKVGVAAEVAALQQMTVTQLKQRYAEVVGEKARSGNKAWLIKRIAWRIQANAYGDLSERARQRALELANDAEIRLKAPPDRSTPAAAAAPNQAAVSVSGDSRLPVPGTELVRKYKGKTYKVMVRPDGFGYGGETFTSLSAVAERITGSHWNGFLFFGLRKRPGGAA